MNRKTIQILAALIVGMVLLLQVLRDRDGSELAVNDRQLLPEFKAVANDATQITARNPDGNEAVIIHRRNDRWAVSTRDDYTADVGKLRQLIIALAEAKIVEEKTSNPEQYEKLGVGDPEQGGKGSKVTIIGPDFSYTVILGDKAQGNYRYARIDDEETSYLIDQDPDIPQSVGDWLSPDIIDIGSQRVRKISIAHADGEAIVIAKSDQEQTDFDVLDIPNGRELSYATVGNGIAGALGSLTLQDVRAHIESPPTTTVEYETWEGQTVTAEVVSDDETSWVDFSASTTSDESTGAEEVEEINKRLSGWQYKLPDHKKNLLTRHWDDILRAQVQE